MKTRAFLLWSFCLLACAAGIGASLTVLAIVGNPAALLGDDLEEST